MTVEPMLNLETSFKFNQSPLVFWPLDR
jgi:hypothetical protein